MRLYGEQLALIVPFIKRRCLIEALVALQPDQFGAVDRRERLADPGLADAGPALEQQRALQELRDADRRRQFGVGDVARAGQARGYVVAGEGHGRSACMDS